MNRRAVRIIHNITIVFTLLCLLIPAVAQNSFAGENTSAALEKTLQTYVDGERLCVYLPPSEGSVTDVLARIDTAADAASEISDLTGISGAGIHTVILFDNSSTISEHDRDKMKQAVKELISGHQPGEVFSLILFDSAMQEQTLESADYDALLAQVDAFPYNGQETDLGNVLYDAFFQYGGPSRLFTRFVVLSGGRDIHSDGHTAEEIRQLYEGSGYPFYSIGSVYGDAASLNQLFDISRACGSSSFLLDNQEDMSQIASRISAEAPQKVALVKLPAEVRDGSSKPLRITVRTDQGSTQYLFEEQMPGPETGRQSTEAVPETIAETAQESVGTKPADPAGRKTESFFDILKKDSFIPGISWLIVGLAGIGVIAAAVLVIILVTGHRRGARNSGTSARTRSNYFQGQEPVNKQGYPDFTRESRRNPSRETSYRSGEQAYMPSDPTPAPARYGQNAQTPGSNGQNAGVPRGYSWNGQMPGAIEQNKQSARTPDRFGQDYQSPGSHVNAPGWQQPSFLEEGDETMRLHEDADDRTMLIRRAPQKTLLLVPENGGRSLECAVRQEMTIGRKQECDISLPEDKAVSGRHCTITAQGDQLFIRDENSSNGTFLNGQQVQGERRLQDGDTLEIGRSKYRVQIQ